MPKQSSTTALPSACTVIDFEIHRVN